MYFQINQIKYFFVSHAVQKRVIIRFCNYYPYFIYLKGWAGLIKVYNKKWHDMKFKEQTKQLITTNHMFFQHNFFGGL